MGKDSKIEWTHHTFNPWWGCVEVSPACAFCYAKAFAKRLGYDIWGSEKLRRFFPDSHWHEPLKWDGAAKESGERHRVFSGSMCDIFEHYSGPDAETLKLTREQLFALIGLTPNLQWLLLTKRPENMIRFAPKSWAKGWPENVTAMTTRRESRTSRRPHSGSAQSPRAHARPFDGTFTRPRRSHPLDL